MKYVSGATAEEKRLVTSVQKNVGSYPDNSLGPVTFVDIAVKLGVDCFPLAVDQYEWPCIICRDIVPTAVNAPLKNYANSISGSFSYQSKPCSILVSNGKAICGAACHAWLGKPESVLYKTADGKVGIKRVTYVGELPANLKWAVGGVGLLGNYSPAAEGFTGAYADVLRSTSHTAIGYKRGLFYLVYVPANHTAAQVNDWCRKMNFEMAIMLDGGHVSAINSASKKLNTTQKQFYIVHGV